MSLFGTKSLGSASVAPTFGTTTNPTPAFGAANPTSAFGTTANPTSVFGTTNPTSTFGTQNPTPAFGAKNPISAFGTTNPTFGGTTSAFGNANKIPAFGTTTNPTPFGTNQNFGGVTNVLGTNTQANQASRDSSSVIQQIYKDLTTLTSVVYGPEYLRDARDEVISTLNKLLAACGVGSGYYRSNQAPFNFTPDNYFYRFKGVGYNRLSRHKDKDGIVSLILKIQPNQLETLAQKQKIIDTINGILRKPTSITTTNTLLLGGTQQQQQQQSEKNIYTEVKAIIPLGDEKTELVICVNEQGRKNWTATELYWIMNKDDKLTALKQQIQCEKIVPKLEVNMDDLERYLKRPPAGFEEIWLDAIKNNPDPAKLVPYPIQGFKQLIQRQKMQKSSISIQKDAVKDFNNRLENVEHEIVNAHNKYTMCKQIQKQISHRLLRVLATETLVQRYNLAIDENEEQLQCRLENLSGQLNAPDRLKSRLSTIYNILRNDGAQLKQQIQEQQAKSNFTKEDLQEIKRCLASRQTLLEGLVDTIKSSEKTLNIINNTRDK